MSRRHILAALLVAGLAIIADQGTKWWALTTLRQGGGHVALTVPVDFTFSWNESNAFGLMPVVGHATRWILMSANFVVATLLLHAILRRQLRPLTCFGFALIMAGSTSNALDRLLYGGVVDFIDATKLGFPWIFNFADAILDVGIGLIVLSAVLSSQREPIRKPT